MSSISAVIRRNLAQADQVLDPAQLGRELGQQRGPYLRPVRVLDGRRGVLRGTESTRQPPDLWREPGGEIWPPRPDIGDVSIAGKRSASALATSRSSSHGSAAANRT